MIAIFDYGAGNLRSVQNTLAELNCEYTLIRDAAGLRAADKILLPGVGHFGQMMRALDTLDVREALIERIAAKVPFFGICLGMQALFESSEEAPEVRGLGIYPGIVRRFPMDARVPHMGWNQLESRTGLPACPGPYVYFAHSYYVPENEHTSAACTYGVRFTAALHNENVQGVQFHPEKSGAVGLSIVKSFLDAGETGQEACLTC
jgi:imidazole glycerol phosphate synthase glutamine amidotransferase subunit